MLFDINEKSKQIIKFIWNIKLDLLLLESIVFNMRI
jgi:hypothetical protein